MTLFIDILDLDLDTTNIQDIVVLCLIRVLIFSSVITMVERQRRQQHMKVAITWFSTRKPSYVQILWVQSSFMSITITNTDKIKQQEVECFILMMLGPPHMNPVIPISMQKMKKGKLKIKAEYNIGQIIIGSRNQNMCSNKKSRRKNIGDCLLESDYGDIICTPKRSNQTIPTPKVIVAVSPFYHTGAPRTQDGLVQIQLVDFYPHYNLFSMFDGQQPGTTFSFVQPHLRRVYND